MKTIKFLLTLALPAMLGLTSCSDKDDNPVDPAKQSTGIDMKNLDPTVRPADDFYEYANGGWIKSQNGASGFFRGRPPQTMQDCISKSIDLYVCPKCCTFAPYFIKV